MLSDLYISRYLSKAFFRCQLSRLTRSGYLRCELIAFFWHLGIRHKIVLWIDEETINKYVPTHWAACNELLTNRIVMYSQTLLFSFFFEVRETRKYVISGEWLCSSRHGITCISDRERSFHFLLPSIPLYSSSSLPLFFSHPLHRSQWPFRTISMSPEIVGSMHSRFSSDGEVIYLWSFLSYIVLTIIRQFIFIRCLIDDILSSSLDESIDEMVGMFQVQSGD